MASNGQTHSYQQSGQPPMMVPANSRHANPGAARMDTADQSLRPGLQGQDALRFGQLQQQQSNRNIQMQERPSHCTKSKEGVFRIQQQQVCRHIQGLIRQQNCQPEQMFNINNTRHAQQTEMEHSLSDNQLNYQITNNQHNSVFSQYAIPHRLSSDRGHRPNANHLPLQNQTMQSTAQPDEMRYRPDVEGITPPNSPKSSLSNATVPEKITFNLQSIPPKQSVILQQQLHVPLPLPAAEKQTGSEHTTTRMRTSSTAAASIPKTVEEYTQPLSIQTRVNHTGTVPGKDISAASSNTPKPGPTVSGNSTSTHEFPTPSTSASNMNSNKVNKNSTLISKGCLDILSKRLKHMSTPNSIRTKSKGPGREENAPKRPLQTEKENGVSKSRKLSKNVCKEAGTVNSENYPRSGTDNPEKHNYGICTVYSQLFPFVARGKEKLIPLAKLYSAFFSVVGDVGALKTKLNNLKVRSYTVRSEEYLWLKTKIKLAPESELITIPDALRSVPCLKLLYGMSVEISTQT